MICMANDQRGREFSHPASNYHGDTKMIITRNTTLKEILSAKPEAVAVFLKHDVDVPLECDESIHDCELELCESMCHIDDIDSLIEDLQLFFNQQPVSGCEH